MPRFSAAEFTENFSTVRTMITEAGLFFQML
jgi:hypothetical protein